jgi:hypothetical protein
LGPGQYRHSCRDTTTNAAATNAYAYSDGDAMRAWNANTYADSDSHGNTDGNRHRYSYFHTYIHPPAHTYDYTNFHTEVYSNTEGSSHAAASPLEIFAGANISSDR